MRNSICVLLFVSLVVAAAAAQNPTPTTIPNGLPEWAYNIPDKVQPSEPKVPATVRVSGSAKEYEASAIAGNTNPPDWFPDEHPAPPKSVKGPMPNACGSCHLMSGQGHPESADIAGLPAEYIIRQMKYFKSRARKEEDRMGPIASFELTQNVGQMVLDRTVGNAQRLANLFVGIAPRDTAQDPQLTRAEPGRHGQDISGNHGRQRTGSQQRLSSSKSQ